MKLSIVIPTYNRAKELDEALDSVISQTSLPEEVIIVDDSDDDAVENLTGRRGSEFEEKGVFLRYIRNKREKSLTIARNIGIESATGDIILFLDDDVVLDKDYIKEILRVYEEEPDALGVQGYITNVSLPRRWNAINKILFLGHLEKNRCSVLPSTNTTYPYPLERTISCEWLSGSNQSYKRSVLERFRYDENLKRYSYKEDVDLSYRVYRQHPDSLYMTPHAKLVHKTSQEARLPDRVLIHMQQIHSLYFFYKNIDQSIMNKLTFLWCKAGYLLVNVGDVITHYSNEKFLKLKYIIGAYIACMKHAKELKRGELDFFNRRLE